MAFPRDTTLADIGEFGLITEMTKHFAQGEQVLVGPGDDAALVRVKQGHVVVSTDLLVEGRHFRRDWAEASHIGHRAAGQNLADIAAMGGVAHSMTLGLALPSDLPAEWAVDFAEGFAAECSLVGASVVGGDVTGADQIVISVTAIGAVAQAPVLRSGAEPGDVLALCGRQGWAAAGLAILKRGFRSPRVLVDAYRRPQPPYAAGPAAAAAGASALIDVSDGLLSEARHIADASEVSIDVHTAALTIPDELNAVASATGADALAFVLGGGEDHSLLAAFPPDVELPDGWIVIGTIGEPGGEPVTVDGEVYEGSTGWTHF